MEIHKNLSLVDLDGEEWKDVVGYDGIYQVSNMGRVKSLRRYDTAGHLRKEFIKKQTLVGGKLYTPIYDSTTGKCCPKLVSGLIGEAFIGFREENEVFCHLNKIATDNRLANIRKMYRSESALLDFQVGKQKWNGFLPTPSNLKQLKRNDKGMFLSHYRYKSEYGIFSYSELISAYGSNIAKLICKATKTGYHTLGVKWEQI